MEVAERWGEAYGVFQQGNSRVVSVPSGANCEVDDGVRVWSIQKDEQILCVNYVMSSLDTADEMAARTAAINRSQGETEAHRDCNKIREHNDQKIVTIPGDCKHLYPKESRPFLFVGKTDDDLFYLKYVPRSHLDSVKFDGVGESW